MQAGCRLIEQVQRSACRSLAKFSRQFHALSFPAGQCRRRLTQMHVIQTHVAQGLEHAVDFRKALEQLQRFADIQVQDVRNAVIAEFDLESFVIETPSFADIAGNPDVRQKIHVQLCRAVSFAGFAPTIGDVEAETTFFVASHL